MELLLKIKLPTCLGNITLPFLVCLKLSLSLTESTPSCIENLGTGIGVQIHILLKEVEY